MLPDRVWGVACASGVGVVDLILVYVVVDNRFFGSFGR